jgi:hypothetical protein
LLTDYRAKNRNEAIKAFNSDFDGYKFTRVTTL